MLRGIEGLDAAKEVREDLPKVYAAHVIKALWHVAKTLDFPFP